MKNHELYKELKVIAKDYTVAQAEALIITQIRGLLRTPVSATCTFIKNMRGTLVAELQRKQNEADEQQIKETLDTGFPGWKNTVAGKELHERLSIKSAKPVEVIE